MKRALLLVLLVALAPLARAQAPAAPAPAAADIALVRELLAASGAEKQYEQMMAVMSEGMRNGFRRGFNESLKGKALDDAKRAQASAIAERNFQALQRDFDAAIQQLMPYEKMVSEIYGPLYLKHFTKAEIAEATAFYRSPTGRRLAGAIPQLMQESSRIVNERYLPQLIRSTGQQMEQHMKRMAEELKKL